MIALVILSSVQTHEKGEATEAVVVAEDVTQEVPETQEVLIAADEETTHEKALQREVVVIKEMIEMVVPQLLVEAQHQTETEALQQMATEHLGLKDKEAPLQEGVSLQEHNHASSLAHSLVGKVF